MCFRKNPRVRVSFDARGSFSGKKRCFATWQNKYPTHADMATACTNAKTTVIIFTGWIPLSNVVL